MISLILEKIPIREFVHVTNSDLLPQRQLMEEETGTVKMTASLVKGEALSKGIY